MLLGHLRADVGDARVDVGAGPPSFCDGRSGSREAARPATPARSARRCRNRRAAGTRRDRDNPTAAVLTSLSSERSWSSTCAGSPSESRSSRAAEASSAKAAISRSSSLEAPADTGAAPRIIPSTSDGGTPVQSTEVGEQVADREHRRAGEAHVLVDHLRVVIAAFRQVRRPAPASERASGSTDCSSRWVLTAAGLATSSHSRSCSRQSFCSNTSSARWKRSGISSSADRCHRAVREAVDIRHLHAPPSSIP